MRIAGDTTSFHPSLTGRASSTSRLSSSCGNRSELKRLSCTNLWSLWNSSWLHGPLQTPHLISSLHRSGRRPTPPQQPCRSVPVLLQQDHFQLDLRMHLDNRKLVWDMTICRMAILLAKPELVRCSSVCGQDGARTELPGHESSRLKFTGKGCAVLQALVAQRLEDACDL